MKRTLYQRMARVESALDAETGDANDGHPRITPLFEVADTTSDNLVVVSIALIEYLLVRLEDQRPSLDPSLSPQSQFDSDHRAGVDE